MHLDINKIFFFFILGGFVVLDSLGIVILLLVVLFNRFSTKRRICLIHKGISIDIGIIGIVFPVNGEVIGILILLL